MRSPDWTVAIRADASDEIGSGHVMRCLSLAEGLVARGARVRFVCRALPGHMIGQIEKEGHAVIALPAPPTRDEARDAEATVAALGPGPVDWLIVDHYQLGARWESALRPHARRIMAIDDLADRAHDCDLLLDQNLNAEAASRYRSLVGAQTRCLFGPRYALLRPAFASIAPRRREPVRRILVFFGGADRPNATGKTVAAIARLAHPDLAVDVVLGAMRADDGELDRLCASLPKCRVWRDADMAALMRDADLAVGAGGTTSWERCAAGLPTLAWPIADNQRAVLAGLAAIGAVYLPTLDSVASADGIAQHLNALINNPALRESMAERARAVCDGRGVSRVIAAMQAFELAIAPATVADCEILFRWRNHPTIRAVSTQTASIAWSDHEQWFKASLTRDDRLLLIGRIRDTAIGVVRFDRLAPDVAEISIYLDPERLGSGFGAKLLSDGEGWLAKAWPQVHRLTATVKSGNIASERLFENGGYTRVSSTYEKAC